MEYYIFLGFFVAAIILVFVGFFVGKKADAEWKHQAQYYPVSPLKFIILSYVTMNFYIIFWFYKNWCFVKERDKSTAWPFWRAVFSGLWFYPLMNNVRNNSNFNISTVLAAFLAISFFVVGGLSNRYGFSGDYPIPILWGLVLDFVPMALILPLVSGIVTINGADNPATEKNSRFGPLAIIAILVAGPLALWTTGQVINAIPTAKLYNSTYLWQKDKDYISDVAFFDEDESLVYFYSDGLFSIKEDGNILTTKKIVSYGQDLDGETQVFSSYFEEIELIEVMYGSYLESTIMAVYDQYGDGFYVYLPGKKASANKFIDRLELETGVTATEVEF